MRGTNKCMSSYFPFIANILCGLCSHSSSGSQWCYRGSWGAPSGPLLGETWIGTMPLVTLPNVSLDGQETCWAPFLKEDPPKYSQSQNSIRLGVVGERCGFCWQQNVSCCESDSAVAVSMNYWRISDDNDNDDGQAFVCAPSPPGSGQTQVMWSVWRQ